MKEISEIILGEGVSWMMFFAYIMVGVFGLTCSVLFDIYSSGIAANEFKFKKFIYENEIRILLSILAVIVGVLFHEQLLGSELNTWTAFLSGFMSDKIIENLMNRRKKKLEKDDK